LCKPGSNAPPSWWSSASIRPRLKPKPSPSNPGGFVRSRVLDVAHVPRHDRRRAPPRANLGPNRSHWRPSWPVRRPRGGRPRRLGRQSDSFTPNLADAPRSPPPSPPTWPAIRLIRPQLGRCATLAAVAAAPRQLSATRSLSRSRQERRQTSGARSSPLASSDRGRGPRPHSCRWFAHSRRTLPAMCRVDGVHGGLRSAREQREPGAQ
jgi:hypothetical protein